MAESDEVEQGAQQIRQIAQGIRSFAEDMRSQDIHVGMPLPGDSVVRCVNCGALWPCASSRPVEPEETE